MLRCRDVVRYGDHFLSGDIRGWRRAFFWLHLMLCRDCRRYIRQLATTQAVSAALPPAPSAADAEIEAVMHRLHQAQTAEERPGGR